MENLIIERIISFLNAYDRMRDTLIYPIKGPLDNITCQICAGKYTRRDKSKHSRTKRHKEMENLIYTGDYIPVLEWQQICEDEDDYE